MEVGQELQTDILSGQELNSLKNLFGDKELTTFNKKEGKIFVNTVLEDGIAEGGQRIALTLSEMKLIEKSRKHEWVNAFEVEILAINGVGITDDLGRIFFEVRKETGAPVSGTLSQRALIERQEKNLKEWREKEEAPNPMEDHMLEVYGTSTAPDQKGWRIISTTFKSADDLVSVFHEQGHIEDPDYYTANFLQVRSDNWLNNMFPSGFDSKTKSEKIEIVNTWKAIIGQEVVAHKNAINIISRLSNKVKIFKDDSESGFVRVKKSLEHAMLGYINQAKGWYKNQVSPRDIAKLTNIA